MITENFTKQRMEQKARTVDGVKSTWTIDGRIVCLPTSVRKETIVHERDLDNLRELCGHVTVIWMSHVELYIDNSRPTRAEKLDLDMAIEKTHVLT